VHNEGIHILCLVSDVLMVTKSSGIRLLRQERCELKTENIYALLGVCDL
jgi:hypothetical protein